MDRAVFLCSVWCWVEEFVFVDEVLGSVIYN
jgi:hypothetical protein